MRRISMMSKSTDGKSVKKLPEGDNGTGVLCKTRSGKRYIIAQNTEKGKHTLWLEEQDGYKKIAVADSPYDLYPLVDWEN